MARFLEGYKPKKKKKEETVKKAQSPSVSTKTQNRAQQAQQQKMYGGTKQQPVKRAATNNSKTTTQKRQQTTSQQTQRTVDRLQQKYGQNRVERQEQQRRFQPNANTQRMSKNPRMLDTSGNINPRTQSRQERESRLREAQRQKMGLNSMASKETQEAANRAIRNTPSLVKKALKDTVSGHLQTIADVTEMTASNKNGTMAKAMKMGIQDNPQEMRKLEQRQQQTVEKAKLDREKWAAEQEKRQQAWDKKVNGAKGAEKAYYGAVESGTGMLTDLALGLGTQGGSLAAMFSRTYGTTRGQAQKEGATEAEDRTYSFLQAAKEVGTELMFPGVGLARGYAKKTGLPLAERFANNLTSRIANRTAADLTGAGVRLLGGTAEENLEEVAGFGLDPLIKEFSYGRNVRTRQKMADLQTESDQLRANIQSEDDARRVASYLSSSEWLDQNKQQYMEAGLSDKDAQEVAEKMRDYMTASLTGDTETMDVLEQDIARTLSKGEFSYTKSLDKSELLDTLASTTLLTMTTGLPGTATTAMRGSVIRDNLGTDGIRTLAESAMNYEDAEASKRGQVARDRINAGKELTASEVYELAASQAQQVEKDTRRVVAKNNVVTDTLESEKLVAPMIMRDDKGNISGDEIIIQRYNDSAQEAENALRDIDKEQKLSISDSELAVGSRAIAGFQTGAFTINDANALNYTNTAVREAFEKVTGVDLGQYVVKTSSGAVDYAATNAATKDALFTMAADNFIETARAETENFKDKAKGITAEQMAARVGSEGDIAISTALDTVDPADEDTYGLMASAAQNVYEYGRFTEDTWDDVSANLSEMYPGLSQEALQDVYDAAKRDKAIAENPYYNARITAGESTRNMDMSEAEQAEYGKFTNDTGLDIGMKERAVLESIAREFNINIRLLPSEFFEYKYVDRNGKEKTAYSNGSYDPKTGTMLLNGGNDMERNIIAVALHEITHHIAIYAPDEYLALSNRVMEAWYKNDVDAFNAAIKRKQDSYKAQVKQNLSEEQALEEVIADAMGEMSADPDFISQICTEEPSLAEQIINAIRSVMRKLRAILASGNVAEGHEDAFFNQLGIWDDAQRLWLEAAKVAQQNRASQMIDDWDANARMTVEEQTEALANEIEAERYSIVEDKDLIRRLDADSHINTYRAMALIDGKLYPPMATKVKDENGKWTLQQGMDIGQWVESDITTDSRMFDKDGKFHLKKDDGSDVYAAYNPYIHSSDSMLNDQFATAYKRPNLVVVEGEIPESELTSGYRAEHDLDDGRHVVAKDTTGITDWKAGVVQGQLSGRRTVYLTQHFKPTRIVPDSEVAQHINNKVAGTGVVIPYNVVTPSVRAELQKLGTEMGQSKEEKYYVADADIMSEEEIQERLKENFDEYKEDAENLKLATEAITDLQNVRYSVGEDASSVSGRWSRGEQVRTIGKGITADLVNEGYVEFRGRKVKGPEDLAKLCQVLRDPRFETFRVVLTKGDKIVSLRSISSRLPGLAQAFESENISDGVDIVRDRMKRTGADGYYLIHNHPSGNVTASFADLSVTRAYLALLGQDTYKGHIILDHDKYGFIDADVPQIIRGENFPTAREESITGQQTFDLIHEPEIDHPLLGEEIHGHVDIAKCGQFVNASDDVSVLLYTNSPGEVTGIQEISNKTLKNNKEITGFIRNQGVEFGAASAYLYTTDIETYQASKDLVKSGHLVDSVVAYGNNRQWSESAREVVSPRADVEVLGQVYDDVIRRTHVFESATGATEYRYSLPETDNEGKALTQDQREFFRDVAPELLDDNGNIKRYFHGTARADRVGYYFNPERATSGPMAYFTDNRDIATNYSRDKADTSLAYEGEDVNDYHNQFVVDVDGEEVRLEDYWYQLPANKRIEYRERAGHITYDYDGEDDTALIIDENVNNGNGGYGADPYLVRQARGNAFRMLIDAWLDSGDFFNEEERFLEVMDLLGMEGVRYKDPNYRDEKVYEVYLNVTNPLVTTELDEEFAADIEDWLDNTDLDYYARESASADMWDKNDRNPYDWLDALRDDIENGTTHVWTSIPDVITDFLKEQGYDGIVDQGGKYHEAGHQVVIPFEPNQIKLTTNEHPTDDVDIRYSIAETDSEGNFLSDGQRRYFNNSLAVDEQGRLVPVYHTTNVGVFTIFDPARSDDHRSLFFTNSRRMSESYSKRGGRSTNDINPYSASNVTTQIDDVNNLPDFLDDDIIQRVRDRISNIIVRDAEGNVVAQGNDFVDVARQFAPIMIENDYDPDALDYLADDAEYAMNDAWQLYADAETLSGLTYTMDFAEMTGTYSCYLNFENPLIIDNEQSDNWQSIRIPKELQEGMWNYFGYMFSAASTRQYAEYAQEMGYDGVILRNIVDYADYGYGNEPADVYIAFSSEQVKDIRNTDPTNNPDIRYSIVDDEEAQSKMAYDDAMDTSYEALSYYETLIDEPEEQIELYAESFSEDKINDFYAGLNSYSEYFVFDDPVLEEGRKRMARSRADFMERLNAEWNERWLTDGEILDIRSVRKDVREMVKSIMRNADTPNKVKNDIVNKTLIDIRLAYQFAKKGRIDVADALLWHTSMRMIEGVEFVNDDTFNEYKDLRDYLRTTRIQLGEEYWSDVDYQAFRKNNFGRIKLVKGETNVDEIYQEMCERWPEWFNEEEEMTPPDQLLQIEHVLDVIQPYKEAYSSEEAASIATDIAYDLSDIVYGKGKPYESIADKYKNRYDKQTQAMRQRHEEALRKVREQREKGIKAERAKWQVREQRRKERQAHKKYFDRIVNNYNWLSERLLTNTKDKHIPEQYKKELARLLAAFDLQTVGSKKVEERRGQKGKKTIKMEAMKKAINNIEAKSEFFHLNDSITDIIDELLGREGDGSYNSAMSIEGKTIDELSVDELIKIDKLLKALKHEFTFYETVRTGAKRTQAADIGTAQVDSALKHAELFGPGKDYNNILGAADKILNMDEMTPAYLFKRIDPQNTGIGMMFRELRRSFDKYVKNQEQLNGWMEEILSPYHRGGKLWKKYGAEEIENWRLAKATNTFKLENGDEIKLTPAQMMSVYCLAKRPQAYQHMVGAGIVVKPVTFQAKLETDLKRKTNWALPTILTDGDIKMISTALTPDQKKVADQLQQLMATKMAAWGNEASRAVIGIDLFEDPDYFPIQSDRAALEEDFTADQFVDMIRNFGFTKAVQPGARNAIAIDDIFTVVSTHCNNMNLYNAYSESMNDFMKVYNYHALREDGSDYSVKQAIAHAYSQKATTFISTFMRDLNGNVSRGRVTGIDNMMNAALGNAKKASVFANGRVALQQPTAIVRAFAVISPKYMKGIKIERGAMQEMFEHCPIALWKSWGYYDINMGKSVEDIMMNNGSWLEDKMTDIYGAADNVTWTAIWQMCKAEVKDKNPKVKAGSAEFWDLVNERMTEVVDLTQVVDSPFHRSHAMRDKQVLVKMATSFMAEPTLTFNLIRDSLVNSFEMYKLGDKAGAAKLLGKTSRVFVLSAFATAAAAAIWDAVRGKQPDGDDDDDGTAIGLWWANTLANFQDNLKLWNDIYYIKDIASLFDGWGTSNLALQGWKQLADGYAQLTGAYRVNSKKAWWENMLAGIGYLSGTPYGTILKDGKALLNILGVHPSFLSAIGEQLDSVQDMLGGTSSGSGTGSVSSNNSSNNKKAGSDESDATSAAVRLWTYDNAPFKVENGSAVDNFLNHFGINLTSAEIAAAEARAAQAEYQKKVDKITESLSEYSGEDYDNHLWDKQDLEGYGKALEEGNFDRADEIEKLFLDCGGSQEFLDGKKLYHYNRNYVKSIVYDPTDAQIEQQTRMKDFLLSHGMTEAELSEKVYKSQTTKELKVAFRLNDEDAIVEELTPLIRAGLSYDDFVKAYKYRNRIDLKKYKDSNGKYAERLKSTGIYNWPVTGTITSHFGYRNSPGGVGSTNHKGLDIAASMGTPVGAADGGTVVFAGWDGGFGKCVRVQHDDGTITEYAHLSWWDAKVGDSVAQGQTIGNVGSTGNSTGPHLHFGVKVNGSYVDPLTKLN